MGTCSARVRRGAAVVLSSAALDDVEAAVASRSRSRSCNAIELGHVYHHIQQVPGAVSYSTPGLENGG